MFYAAGSVQQADTEGSKLVGLSDDSPRRFARVAGQSPLRLAVERCVEQ